MKNSNYIEAARAAQQKFGFEFVEGPVTPKQRETRIYLYGDH
jgi:hypothetical protein